MYVGIKVFKIWSVASAIWPPPPQKNFDGGALTHSHGITLVSSLKFIM